MKILGIIAEYNPFHNGHQYQIEQAKKITGADKVIVIMSGNYVQRGTPAVIDKYARAEMALSCGVDLVIELPLYYACSSAEYFSRGAVSILDQLGVVDYLAFGSESGDITLLTEIATVLVNPSQAFQESVKASIKAGNTYPKARAMALLAHFTHKDSHLALLEQVLSSPNNILGIEYIKALLLRKSQITPVTIKRVGGDYHQEELTTLHSSATAIRGAIQTLSMNSMNHIDRTAATEEVMTQLQTQVPDASYQKLSANIGRSFPVFSHDLSDLLHYKLLLECMDGYQRYVDVTPDLSDRICNKLPEYKDFEQFCVLLKSKDITYTRISRCLLHILLNITKENMALYLSQDQPYARMLGFRKDSSALLSAIKKNSTIPLLSKLADAEKVLLQESTIDHGVPMLREEINASRIYDAIASRKFHTSMKNEYERPMLVL